MYLVVTFTAEVEQTTLQKEGFTCLFLRVSTQIKNGILKTKVAGSSVAFNEVETSKSKFMIQSFD